jgi:hypothetical protein
MGLGLGAGVATGATEGASEGVDGGVKEDLGIGRPLTVAKWVDHKGGASMLHPLALPLLLACCRIF